MTSLAFMPTSHNASCIHYNYMKPGALLRDISSLPQSQCRFLSAIRLPGTCEEPEEHAPIVVKESVRDIRTQTTSV